MWRKAALVLAPLVWQLLWVPIHADTSSGMETSGYFSADGYRIRHYRAPTPTDVPQAITVTTPGLQELMRRQAPILVDVLAVTVRPEIEEFGLSWLPDQPRFDLPGSVWLPNVGYGKLDKRMEEYFRNQLHRLTGGDLDRPIVIYCVIDCWMSWNAIRRAASFGYRRLYWYPEGADGWAAHGLPTQETQPVPLAGSQPD